MEKRTWLFVILFLGLVALSIWLKTILFMILAVILVVAFGISFLVRVDLENKLRRKRIKKIELEPQDSFLLDGYWSYSKSRKAIIDDLRKNEKVIIKNDAHDLEDIYNLKVYARGVQIGWIPVTYPKRVELWDRVQKTKIFKGRVGLRSWDAKEKKPIIRIEY